MERGAAFTPAPASVEGTHPHHHGDGPGGDADTTCGNTGPCTILASVLDQPTRVVVEPRSDFRRFGISGC